jgi:hypothetical protein
MLQEDVWILLMLQLISLNGNNVTITIPAPQLDVIRALLSESREYVKTVCSKMEKKETVRRTTDYVMRVCVMVMLSFSLMESVNGATACKSFFDLIRLGPVSDFCTVAFSAHNVNGFKAHVWLRTSLIVVTTLLGGAKHSNGLTVPSVDGVGIPIALLAIPVGVLTAVKNIIASKPSEARETLKKIPSLGYIIENGDLDSNSDKLAPWTNALNLTIFDDTLHGDDLENLNGCGDDDVTQRRFLLLYCKLATLVVVNGEVMMPRRNLDEEKPSGALTFKLGGLPVYISKTGIPPVDMFSDGWEESDLILRFATVLGRLGKTLTVGLSTTMYPWLLHFAADAIKRVHEKHGKERAMCTVFRVLAYARLHETFASKMIDHIKPWEKWDFENVFGGSEDKAWSHALGTGVRPDTKLDYPVNYLIGALNALMHPGELYWTVQDELSLLESTSGSHRSCVANVVPRTFAPAFENADEYSDSETHLSGVFACKQNIYDEEDKFGDDTVTEAPVFCKHLSDRWSSTLLSNANEHTLRTVTLQTWGALCVPLAEKSITAALGWSPEDGMDALFILLRTAPTDVSLPLRITVSL